MEKRTAGDGTMLYTHYARPDHVLEHTHLQSEVGWLFYNPS
jgi:hypothetical protein